MADRRRELRGREDARELERRTDAEAVARHRRERAAGDVGGRELEHLARAGPEHRVDDDDRAPAAQPFDEIAGVCELEDLDPGRRPLATDLVEDREPDRVVTGGALPEPDDARSHQVPSIRSSRKCVAQEMQGS